MKTNEIEMTNEMLLNQLKDCELLFKRTEGDNNKWVSTRRYGIGGSEIGTICGVNPYACLMDLYLYKVYGTRQEFTEEAKERMRWGTILEDVIAMEFERKNNAKCYKIDMLKNKNYNFLLANVDRLITENGEVTAILECKTAGASSKDDWINGIIPVSYVYQVQWYMYITGIHKSYIAGLIGGQVYTQKEIIYDSNLIENILLPKAWDFWHKNVLAKEEPEIDGSQAAVNFIKNKYPTPTSKEICSLDTDYEEMIIKLKELKEKKAEIEEEINLYENKIKLAMDGGSKAETNNFYINWGLRKTTRVDTDRLKKDFLYDEYSKQSEFRVFIIKEK